METAKATLLHYIVDSRASRFTVQAFASGILSAMGHNPKIGIRNFSGEVDFNADAMQASGFRLSMKADSLGVLDDISDKARRRRHSSERIPRHPINPVDLARGGAVNLPPLLFS